MDKIFQTLKAIQVASEHNKTVSLNGPCFSRNGASWRLHDSTNPDSVKVSNNTGSHSFSCIASFYRWLIEKDSEF
jgi:hypothetical protein